ncbi:hypothetical protein QA596_11650 [Balneolales bacterium ANBcel1]|nr:hypothetical protein [Balneolales bacterium ANBcel1]
MKHKTRDELERPLGGRSLAELIAKRAELYLIQTPQSYEVEFALIDHTTGDVAVWLEVICRPEIPQKKFPVDIELWMAGIRLAEETGKPFLLGYRWENRDYLLQVQSGSIPLVLIDTRNPEGSAFVRIPEEKFHLL